MSIAFHEIVSRSGISSNSLRAEATRPERSRERILFVVRTKEGGGILGKIILGFIA